MHTSFWNAKNHVLGLQYAISSVWNIRPLIAFSPSLFTPRSQLTTHLFQQTI